MVTLLIGAIINIVLDPIFIFGMDMGVSGLYLVLQLFHNIFQDGLHGLYFILNQVLVGLNYI